MKLRTGCLLFVIIAFVPRKGSDYLSGLDCVALSVLISKLALLCPRCIHAGHTHAVIDQRFSRISIRLRAKDSLTPPELASTLDGLFIESERDVWYEFLPGFEGVVVEERAGGPDAGPGDFKDAFSQYVQRFDGLGTDDTGRRYSPITADRLVISQTSLLHVLATIMVA